MKHLASGLILGTALICAGAAQADPLATPAMSGPLTANPTPLSFDAGLGTVYVTGAVSGLAFYQTNAQHLAPGDGSSTFDFTNAQVSIQKTDGLVQFYVQAGEYSLPSVGSSYLKASTNTSDTFGVIPVAYLKIAPTDTFSIEAGKLPTLIGAEYTFTTENMNIERGLMWFQEPAISRGVQANYASGPLSIQVSVNDGYYSDRFNWLTGLISYAFNPSNTLAFAAGGNMGKTDYAKFTTPYNLNNGQVYNLLYTYTSAPWLINPYVQYQTVQKDTSLGLTASGSEWAVGVLADYALDANWNIAGRAEYEASSGADSLLIYGPKSKAWSLTLTPTWQKKIFFIRADASYTAVSDAAFGFGKSFNKDDQARVMLEAGIVF
jgi:Putative beta-barrel porin-2, OmpL-like. bbp2